MRSVRAKSRTQIAVTVLIPNSRTFRTYSFQQRQLDDRRKTDQKQY